MSLVLTALKQQDGNLSQVEVDEVPGFVSHVGAEIPAHYAMPGRVVLLVELFLDVGGDVLQDDEMNVRIRHIYYFEMK